MNEETRWYKGKHKVAIIKKLTRQSKHGPMTCHVQFTEDATITLPKFLKELSGHQTVTFYAGETLTTIPRLLWRHPAARNCDVCGDKVTDGPFNLCVKCWTKNGYSYKVTKVPNNDA